MSKDKGINTIEEKETETEKKSLFKYTGPAKVWYEGNKVHPADWTVAQAKDAIAKYPKVFEKLFVF